MSSLSIASWNVAGTYFLKLSKKKRVQQRLLYNKQLSQLISKSQPDIILLQEVVRYEEKSKHIDNLFEIPENYYYQFSVSIDTLKNCYPPLWNKIRKAGEWSDKTYLSHGLGILWKKKLKHSSLWSIAENKLISGPELEKETVRFESGLFSGNRDTEPRMALVSRFHIAGQDLFIVNFHLTTLKGEREGFPERDQYGRHIRISQIDTILNGIISRLNNDRKLHSEKKHKELKPGLWLLAGDLNATINSAEVLKFTQNNFARICSDKASKRPTNIEFKAKKATIKVDYIFAGPLYYACQPSEIKKAKASYNVIYDLDISDHYPIVAKFPLGT
jgi:endonuclease/exonuclease/phosphatase family metal-dependent hydrolase